MNYVYVLEGQLKYEKIEYYDHLTFELYNKYGPVDDNNDTSVNLVYYLKSEIDMSISLDGNSKQINVSMPENASFVLFDHNGMVKENESRTNIEITDDLFKVSFPELEFSFLLNSTNDFKIDPINERNEHNNANKTLHKVQQKLKFIIPAFSVAILIIFFLMQADVPGKKVIFFDNQSDLMKADLYSLNAKDVFVKSELKKQIQKILDENGVKYVRFELIESRDKVNLLMYIFEKNNDDLEKTLELSNISWLNEVIFHALDPKNMYEDFNAIADKYELEQLNIFTRDLSHRLVAVDLTNTNLRYNSIQRDTKTFTERWGKNYIEFNVNLVQKEKLPFDFMMSNGNERVVKSGQGYYFN